MSTCKGLYLLPLLVLLAACQSQPKQGGPVQPREFVLSDVVKSDIDMVAEVGVRQSLGYLRELAHKLYLRNPNQLRRAAGAPLSLDQALDRLFERGREDRAQLQGRRAGEAIGLAFDEGFGGDRVAALISGLRDMLHDAYGGEGEFFLHHEFDPQKIYHLARNLEIASWRLRNRQTPAGELYLLSTGSDGNGVANTSFERLFGKLIAVHDHFAHVVADTTNRRIKNVIQGVASAVFFPI